MNAAASPVTPPVMTDNAGKTLGAVARATDWIDGKLNPILVKDIRGWLRSRIFLIVFFVGLAASTITTVTCALIAGEEIGIGKTLYSCIIWGLGFVLGGVVPYLMQDKLAEELQNHSTELAFISRLTPAQLVRGKIYSGLASSILFLSATSPGLTVAYMIGGIGLDVVLYTLVALLALSTASMMLAILFVAMRGKKTLKLLSLGLFSAGLGIASTLTALVQAGSRGRGLFSAEFMGINALIALHLLPILYFLYTVAISRMTFAADNSDSRPRIALSAMTAMSFLAILFFPLLMDSPIHSTYLLPQPATYISLGFFLIGFLFIADTNDTLSRRIKANWPLSRFKRLFLYPGSGRLYAYALAHLGVFVTLAGLSFANVDPSGFVTDIDDDYYRTVAVTLLLCSFLAGSAIGADFLRRWGVGQPRSILLVSCALVWSIAGIVMSIFKNVLGWADTVMLVSPPSAIAFVGSTNTGSLSSAAGMAILASLIVLVPAVMWWVSLILDCMAEDRNGASLRYKFTSSTAPEPSAAEEPETTETPST